MADSNSPILSQIPYHFQRNKEYQFFMILDSLEYNFHVITIQIGVLCLTSEQRGYVVTAQVKKGKPWNLTLKLLM